MPTKNPRTPREWEQYIGTLRGAQLRSKALAAGSVAFVRQLQEEGYKPKEIEHIFDLFARRFYADGQMPPGRVSGVYINYAEIAAELELG
jgi:hypothetical protein